MAIKKSYSVCLGWLRNYYSTNLKNNKIKFFQNLKIVQEANLRLTGGKVVWGEIKNGDNSPKNQWAAIEAAREKMGKICESLIVVSLYNQVRTYFTQNY